MTQEEAMTKDCCGPPIVAVVTALISTGAKFDRKHVKCTGSNCMAWRTAGRKMFRDAVTGKLSEADLTGNGSWVWPEGYCGIAGAE